MNANVSIDHNTHADPGVRMPVLFVGHGSPMNALEENEFVEGWKKIAGVIPRPAAILCISAHWETRGTFVTAMKQPRTLHDFGGFPCELFNVQYPAPGAPEIAAETREMVVKTNIGADDHWGLDHGCWSVLCRMYPAADIPVFQLSLDYTQPARYHFELAKELSALRKKGVLILGSGNMVHNLRLIDWNRMQEPGFGYDWAIEAGEKMKTLIHDGNFEALINYSSLGKAFDLAIPSPEHFLPLLYTLALKEPDEDVSFFNDRPVMGSMTMTSALIGSP
ncbi:MAG: 4,5-DOPA dioxygenase extradiol [Alphaproteobacteria bacterium]|nr:4,5-DOPA dioxygenase extradiol [Alphaproteobacteria bacterium]